LSLVSEEVILKLLDLMSVLGAVLVSAILAYFFGVKKLLKEKELSRQENALYEKIELYSELVQDLIILPELGNRDKAFKEKYARKLNKHGLALLQFAPDNVFREYMKVLRNIRKGKPMTDVLEFMITLRKELIPDTTLRAEEHLTIEKFD
jgi:hypothetical protein